MPTLVSILYDPRARKYLVRLGDSTGAIVETKERFDTRKEAEDFLNKALADIGVDPHAGIVINDRDRPDIQ